MPRDAPTDNPYRAESFDPAKAERRALALLPETRREYARRANRLRKNAVETCPTCLYDVSGVLEGDETRTCPECGSPTSRPINTLIWGERDVRATVGRNIALFGGLAVGLAISLVLLLDSVISSRFEIVQGALMMLTVIAFGAGAGLPYGVSVSAARWLRLRNPTMTRTTAIASGVLIGAGNVAVAAGMMIGANAVLRVW